MAELYVKYNNVWRLIGEDKDLYIKHNDVWVTCTDAWIKDNNVWRSTYVKTTSGGGGATCFLAGQLITMADGSTRSIENVKIGEYVLGRWGVNKVLGYDRPLLGKRPIYLINGEVYNTSDHLTWTKKGWAVIKKQDYLSNDYQMPQFVITNHHTHEGEYKIYNGVDPNNVYEYTIGDLIAHSSGFKEVFSIDAINMPEETQLYALVTDGDHTIHVDGYVFSGWANDQDYNYNELIGT